MKQQTTILMTGASSGIGKAAAVHWAKLGHHVIAGVRRDEDGKALTDLNLEIEAVLLDVTKPQQIEKAWAEISKKNIEGPFHLVNNAGIAVTGPVEALPMTDFRHQFDVNFFGAIQMIQTFLPLVRKTKGRIVNVSSISGKLATPYMGPYCSSKFALEGLSDSLRLELRPFGVKVILVEPGPIDTPIWDKGFNDKQKIIARFQPDIFKLYQSHFEKFFKAVQKVAAKGDPVEKVTAQLDRALFLNDPKPRYTVGVAAYAGSLIAKLPSRMVDSIVSMRR